MEIPRDYTAFLPSVAGDSPSVYSEYTQTTIAQINRDLGYFNEDWKVDAQWNLAELVQDLAECLAKIHRDTGKLPQLMYRIDVSEARLAEILGTYPGEEGWLHVAALVWQRELKKVWLRKLYSSGEGDRE